MLGPSERLLPKGIRDDGVAGTMPGRGMADAPLSVDDDGRRSSVPRLPDGVGAAAVEDDAPDGRRVGSVCEIAGRLAPRMDDDDDAADDEGASGRRSILLLVVRRGKEGCPKGGMAGCRSSRWPAGPSVVVVVAHGAWRESEARSVSEVRPGAPRALPVEPA
jgi:hypothetical protein